MPSPLLVTDKASLPTAKALIAFLAKHRALKTRADVLKDPKAALDAVVIALDPAVPLKPKATSLEVAVTMSVPGGLIEQRLSWHAKWVSTQLPEVLMDGLALITAPFLAAPKKRDVLLFRSGCSTATAQRECDRVVNALADQLRAAGLTVLPLAKRVVDGKEQWSVNKTKSWARLEVDFIHDRKCCLRARTAAGTIVGSEASAHAHAITIGKKAGEDPKRTQERLMTAIVNELLLPFGCVPSNFQATDAKRLAWLESK